MDKYELLLDQQNSLGEAIKEYNSGNKSMDDVIGELHNYVDDVYAQLHEPNGDPAPSAVADYRMPEVATFINKEIERVTTDLNALVAGGVTGEELPAFNEALGELDDLQVLREQCALTEVVTPGEVATSEAERALVADLDDLTLPLAGTDLNPSIPDHGPVLAAQYAIQDIRHNVDISPYLHENISSDALAMVVTNQMQPDFDQMSRDAAFLEAKEELLAQQTDYLSNEVDHWAAVRTEQPQPETTYPNSDAVSEAYAGDNSTTPPQAIQDLDAILQDPGLNFLLDGISAQEVTVADAVTASPGYAANSEHIQQEHDLRLEEERTV